MLNIIHDQIAARIDNIKRFNGNSLLKEESVSQHSFWVIFYVNLLLKDIFYNQVEGEQYNELFVITIRKAVLHDFDEAFCSDTIYPVKYHKVVGTTIKDALQKIVEFEINELKSDLLSNELKEILSITNKLSEIIIKVADWLSLYHFLYGEYKLGNRQEEIIKVMNLSKLKIGEKLEELEELCTQESINYSQYAVESVLS